MGDAGTNDWQWIELAASAPDTNAPARFRYRMQGRFPVQRLDVAMPANTAVSWNVSSSDADRKVADAA